MSGGTWALIIFLNAWSAIGWVLAIRETSAHNKTQAKYDDLWDEVHG